jgi:two-component system, chemotaxis family, protein-glutamate methylesterase/glutaminase
LSNHLLLSSYYRKLLSFNVTTMAAKIRTLLIEDSGFMRIVLTDLLRKETSIEVVGTAMDGLDGVKKSRLLLPDVIVTDMVMPNYDGLYVVREVMKERPVPIILLSSLDRADEKIFVALTEGAFDFLDKPTQQQFGSGCSSLLAMIKEASTARCKKNEVAVRDSTRWTDRNRSSAPYDILAIGASTGGPGAVELIVSRLPRQLSLPVVIAQHMPARFIEMFADRLKQHTSLPVSVARSGERLLPGHIYLASGEFNTKVERNGGHLFASFVEESFAEFNCPSIDCLFDSIAENIGAHSIGVILTGMGRDGAKGIKKIRERGGMTIAQDENSSVVYGMPRAAVEYGAISHEISLSEIPNFIIRAL